jgi:hypothetical protein
MQNIVVQFVLAGSGDDVEGWMNILFVVVLAVFWIVGGIIKATKKPQDRQGQQASRKPPVRKVPRSSSVPRDPSSERPATISQDRPRAQPRPVTQIADLEKALRSDTADASQKLVSIPAKPQAELILQELPEITSKPLVELDTMRLDLPKKTTESEEDLPELVLDYSDPDELIKAIVHYEILGPPVSLRDPSHQTLDV